MDAPPRTVLRGQEHAEPVEASERWSPPGSALMMQVAGMSATHHAHGCAVRTRRLSCSSLHIAAPSPLHLRGRDVRRATVNVPPAQYF